MPCVGGRAALIAGSTASSAQSSGSDGCKRKRERGRKRGRVLEGGSEKRYEYCECCEWVWQVSVLFWSGNSERFSPFAKICMWPWGRGKCRPVMRLIGVFYASFSSFYPPICGTCCFNGCTSNWVGDWPWQVACGMRHAAGGTAGQTAQGHNIS